MKTILVTGGAGFIGGCYVRMMCGRDDVKIINLDKLTYAGNLDSLESLSDNPRHEFVQADICDRSEVDQLLEAHRPQAVVHFAAESHVDRSIEAPGEFLRTNVEGTLRLLEASRDYWDALPIQEKDDFRFLHVSTDEVYGTLGETGLFSETTPYSPNSPYSASKAASDHFVNAFHHTFGLPTLMTNCSNNYGPFQFPEKLIPLMIINAFEGKTLPIYGDGTNVRDWLYVEDHCEAIQCVLEKGRVGEKYNIGGNSERTNNEVVNAICDEMDDARPGLPHRPCRSLVQYVTDRPGHDQRYAIDASKIRKELGWEPTETFESGLKRTVAWYLDNPIWIDRVTSGSYQRERLGLSKLANV